MRVSIDVDDGTVSSIVGFSDGGGDEDAAATDRVGV